MVLVGWKSGSRPGKAGSSPSLEVDPERKWIDDLKPEVVRAILKATETKALKPLLVSALKDVDEWLQSSMQAIEHTA
jgi:hypothetical protein